MFETLLSRSTTVPRATSDDVTIREAGPHDDVAVTRLAALDSHPRPAAPVLLAEVGGEPWAAVSVTDLASVADPFRPSAHLVELLLEQARGMRPRHPRRGRPVRPRLAVLGA
jgi:hypothetical protein